MVSAKNVAVRTGNVTLLGFFAAAAAMLALVGASVLLFRNQLESNRLTAQAYEVLSALYETRNVIYDIEAGQRGYIVLGQPPFLERYNDSLVKLPEQLARLRELTADHPAQQRRLQRLDAALQERLGLWRTWVDTRREQGVEAARRLIDAEPPRPQSQGIRYQLTELEREEKALLAERESRQASAVQWYWWGTGALALALFALLGVLYALIRRREAQAGELQAAEDRLRLLAHSVQDYAIITLDPQGRVRSWGLGAERIKGYLPQDILGRHFSVFYPTEDVAAGKPQKLLELAAAQGRVEDEGWRIRKHGSRFWALVAITALRDETGALRGYGKVTRDLTERKRAEEALQKEVKERKAAEQALRELNRTLENQVDRRTADLQASSAALGKEIAGRMAAQAETLDAKQRLDDIIESAMDAIITVDAEQRVVLYNRAAERMFGWPRAEVMGTSLDRFIPERLRTGHALQLAVFRGDGAGSRTMGPQRIVSALRRNGEEFPVEASISETSQEGQKFCTVMMRDVSERMEAERALQASREDLRQLAASAQAAREQEQGRLARELHDELGQLLTSLRLDMGALRSDSPEMRENRIVAMEQVLGATVNATRRIASDLRPSVLDDLGLSAAVEWLVENFRQRTGIECALSMTPPEMELREPHATAVYRILQESLTNVAKHAGAGKVEVSVSLQRDNDARERVVLSIRDDGCGFDPADPRKPASFGLMGLRERAFFLDGEVSIDSAPGRGTALRAEIPVATSCEVPIGCFCPLGLSLGDWRFSTPSNSPRSSAE